MFWYKRKLLLILQYALKSCGQNKYKMDSLLTFFSFNVLLSKEKAQTIDIEIATYVHILKFVKG